jgi:parvulin-like peptidyl-prolyl isomerase
MTKKRAVRYAMVAAVAAAVSLPLLSQGLRAQDEQAAPAGEPAAEAVPAESGDKATDKTVQDKAAEPAAAEPAPEASPADAAAKKASRVIASAGDIEITEAEFETLVAGMPPQDQRQISTQPATRRKVAEHLVKMKALAREAEKRKLHEDPEFQEQMDAIRRQLMAQIENARLQLLASALASNLQGDDAADRKYFEENPDKFGKVQARHILISTRGSDDPNNPSPPLTDEQAKKKADEIRARLVKGEDFAAIAKAESDDPGSKETGGTYTFGRGEMVPAFEQTAFSLKENEISQPVKTQFGYHVIQLQKRLPGTFEESRPSIGAERIEAFVADLLGGPAKLDDSFFNAPPADIRLGAGRKPAAAAPGKPAAPTAPKPADKPAEKGAK